MSRRPLITVLLLLAGPPLLGGGARAGDAPESETKEEPTASLVAEPPVSPAPPEPPPSPTSIAFVIDASGTMNRQLGRNEHTRIASVRISVREAIQALASHPTFEVWGRVYGPEGCHATRALPPASRGRTGPMLRALAAVGAHGPAPLVAAIAEAEQALLRRSGRRVLIVITDGRDSCGGDPADLAPQPGIERHVLGLSVRPSTAGELLAIGEYTEIRSPADLTVALGRIAGDLLSAPPVTADSAHSTSR